jgi:aminopeptidase YwaD
MHVWNRSVRRAVVAVSASGLLLLGVAPNFAQSPTISEASVRGHMEFLASDALNGRGSGTRDEWIAATYIAGQMRRWGIEPLGDNGGFVQAVETATRSEIVSAPTLSVGGLTLTHGREMLAQIAAAAHVAGKVARYDANVPAPADSFVVVPQGQTVTAASVSAAAVVLTLETPQIRSRWDALAASGRLNVGRPWRVVLDAKSFDAVSKLAAGTEAKLDAELRPGHTWNAIGQLKGTDPVQAAEVILLTAHLDHLGATGTGADVIFNGADDDASGSTAVLELAEALARGPRPKRTVMFAWFGSEESGGAGARHFLDHPPVPLDRIVANLEFEMIGRADDKVPPHTLWLTGYERSNLGPELARRGAKIVQDPHPEQNFFSRSDNIQLAYRGIIAQTVSSFGLHTDYHRVSDEVKNVDFTHMTDAIQSMLEPVRWLVNSTFKPEWVAGMKPSAPAGRGRGGR